MNYVPVLAITVGHWPFSDIWLTKIHFGWPNLLYIFNGKVIKNLQNVLFSKKTADQFLIFISTTDVLELHYHLGSKG